MSLSQAYALASRPLPPLSRVLVNLALTVATWQMRAETRKHLTDMPPHILDDIGLDRITAQIEAGTPFWR